MQINISSSFVVGLRRDDRPDSYNIRPTLSDGNNYFTSVEKTQIGTVSIAGARFLHPNFRTVLPSGM